MDSIDKVFAQKLQVLNDALTGMGFAEIDLTSDKWGYISKSAKQMREEELGALHCADYPGVILPAGVCPGP